MDLGADLRRESSHDWFVMGVDRLVTAARERDKGMNAAAVSHAMHAFQMVTIGRLVHDGIAMDQKTLLLAELPTQEAYDVLVKFLQVMNKRELAARVNAFTYKPTEFYTDADATMAVDFAAAAVRLLATDVDPTINAEAALQARHTGG